MLCPQCLEGQGIEKELEPINDTESICPLCGVKVIDDQKRRHAIRIVEARLYDFPNLCLKLNEPLPGRSADIIVSDTGTHGKAAFPSSPQHVYVERKWNDWMTLRAVRGVFNGLGRRDQQLVRMKYWRHVRPDVRIWRALHISERTFYEDKRRIVLQFARAMGLI